MSNLIGTFAPIPPISPLDNQDKIRGAQAGNQGKEDFTIFLKDAVTKLENSQTEAEQATLALVSGQTDDFHTPVIALEKASLTLGLAVTVRNKVLDAYHEIMRMQI
jgi:flagellar hook-basal body complex protein FliE